MHSCVFVCLWVSAVSARPFAGLWSLSRRTKEGEEVNTSDGWGSAASQLRAERFQ